MTYTVTYKPSAERELVDLWISTRILFERPIAVQFEIHDADNVVEDLKVWGIGH